MSGVASPEPPGRTTETTPRRGQAPTFPLYRPAHPEHEYLLRGEDPPPRPPCQAREFRRPDREPQAWESKPATRLPAGQKPVKLRWGRSPETNRRRDSPGPGSPGASAGQGGTSGSTTVGHLPDAATREAEDISRGDHTSPAPTYGDRGGPGASQALSTHPPTCTKARDNPAHSATLASTARGRANILAGALSDLPPPLGFPSQQEVVGTRRSGREYSRTSISW